jgi:hypothetical protein
MAHPEHLLSIPAIDDPIQRFVAVVKFYMTGWHIKPPYVALFACNKLILPVALRSP